MTDRIPTNMRTLLILEIMAASDRAMTPTEIGRAVNLPKQTIHRLCTNLVEEGFLIYEPDGRYLRAARRARVMASGLLFASHSHMVRHQILQNVAQQLRETVNFAVPMADGMSYLDRIETDWAFRVQLPVGTHVPFNCTASGKTFLASLPLSDRKKMISSGVLCKKTSASIDDPETMNAELNQVHEQGYALDMEEFINDMLAIAVPVRNPQGKFVAALAFHGPSIRLNREKLLEGLPILKKGAAALEAALFIDEAAP